MKQCKHKFQPRYDRKWSTALNDLLACHEAIKMVEAPSNTPYLKEETYVFDICVKCGNTIGRRPLL